MRTGLRSASLMRRAWSLTANQEHRLAGILQQIDNPRVLILEKNRFAIRHQVEIGGCVKQLGDAAAHFPLQEAQHAPDFLQRETLAAQFRDYGDLDHLAGAIRAAVPFMTRRDYFSLVHHCNCRRLTLATCPTSLDE
jgi:hypothetical protein